MAYNAPFACLCSSAGQSSRFIPNRSVVRIHSQAPWNKGVRQCLGIEAIIDAWQFVTQEDENTFQIPFIGGIVEGRVSLITKISINIPKTKFIVLVCFVLQKLATRAAAEIKKATMLLLSIIKFLIEERLIEWTTRENEFYNFDFSENF